MNRPDYLNQIEKRITSASDGMVFITSDFLDIADTQAVNKALSRLTEEKKLRRVIRGVYDVPRFSTLLDEYTTPHIEAVAKAIARNFGWTIVPCGDTALNLLGLSPQVPTVWLYISDGPYREYVIGKRKLQFKHTANKDITGTSYKSALVVQALKALGKDRINSQIVNQLAIILSDPEKGNLSSETKYGTAWIHEIAKQLENM